MKTTFHIIEKIFRVLKWDILVIDSYGNIIHLPKHFIVNRGLKVNEKKIFRDSIDGCEIPRPFSGKAQIT
ncbi:hypothetical protein [Algibacter sp. R77976]|uniref:hypothetical protein n=1 Tax=Algibacter sp. R77976 TaxID=3093873 RepID=UPI0037CB1889